MTWGELAERLRWIPVAERLPVQGQYVLVAGGIALQRDGVWFSAMEGVPYRPIQWTVTHWQPLPSAPKPLLTPTDKEESNDR